MHDIAPHIFFFLMLGNFENTKPLSSTALMVQEHVALHISAFITASLKTVAVMALTFSSWHPFRKRKEKEVSHVLS